MPPKRTSTSAAPVMTQVDIENVGTPYWVKFMFRHSLSRHRNEGDSGGDVPAVAMVTMVRRLSRGGRGVAAGDDDDERMV
nr:hypothetical protein [Tanacetum cinerariifolium]